MQKPCDGLTNIRQVGADLEETCSLSVWEEDISLFVSHEYFLKGISSFQFHIFTFCYSNEYAACLDQGSLE